MLGGVRTVMLSIDRSRATARTVQFMCRVGIKVVLRGGAGNDGFGTAQCPCACHKKLSTGSSTSGRNVPLKHCQSCALKVTSTIRL